MLGLVKGLQCKRDHKDGKNLGMTKGARKTDNKTGKKK